MRMITARRGRGARRGLPPRRSRVDLDPDLVHRPGVETRFAELLQQAVAVGDAGRFDVNHARSCGSVSPLTGRPRLKAAMVQPMAVATEQEYGLFIGGESSSRPPARSRPGRARDRRAARPRGDGRRGGRRSRRRGRPRRARRAAGAEDAADRALAPSARARRRDRRRTARSSPSSSRATSARRSPRSRPSSPGASRTSASTRSAIALDRRPLEPDRRLAALLLAEGAGRRLRARSCRGTTR